MKIEYVCHSCLFIEAGGKKIVMDPWFSGSAYCDQWHLFPPPVHTEMLKDTDYILISHGHQ
ncbi:MAG TPA: MBL fold metallo-hydrolase, partial [Bacteroidia bacterium]|nr:MBL fold metallo-hydrolase [Bacteroidia bacterium]